MSQTFWHATTGAAAGAAVGGLLLASGGRTPRERSRDYQVLGATAAVGLVGALLLSLAPNRNPGGNGTGRAFRYPL